MTNLLRPYPEKHGVQNGDDDERENRRKTQAEHQNDRQ
jgi:hypothetical protein